MKRGSARLMVLWTIAVLSVKVLSFSTEANLQSGVNIYVRERNRVKRLVDAGQALGEVVLTGYQDAKAWGEDEDHEELFEEDRWYREKRALKYDSKCRIGPILLDEENPESGTVTVDIEVVNGGEKNAININELYEGGDSNYRLRWQMLLVSRGIPEDFEVEAWNAQHTGKETYNLINLLTASWNDWRDDDDTATVIDGESSGAENEWYKEQDEDDDTDEEYRRRPRNGSIPDIQELGYVRGFRDYPAILTGGVLNPQDDKDEQITVKGIVDLFGVSGTSKVNANSCTVEQLMTIPGIFSEDDLEDQEEGMEIAQAIVEARGEQPDYDVDESRNWWPYKDFTDMNQRISDYAGVKIGNEASEYLIFTPAEDSVFKIRIIGESAGVRHEVQAEGYVKDNKVRYIKWRED
jgi:hypothetical protein